MLDPAEPNLLRDDFPYTRIPPIRFEPSSVAQARPTDVWITDTTFRDGQQARAPYTIDQIVHLEDLTRADLDGFVAPLVASLQELGRQAGVPVKFRLCDTMGFGLPWPEASLPRGVPRLVQFFTRTLGVEPENLEWHGHNDFHRGEVNTVAAWAYGCAAANGPLSGVA